MSAVLYNTLPSLQDASDRVFGIHDGLNKFLKHLAPAFASYLDEFGICLVHRHFTLQDEERMISTGLVSKPDVRVGCYPERWLASGEPYEFSSEPTRELPVDLAKKFQERLHSYETEDADGKKPIAGFVGIYYINKTRSGVSTGSRDVDSMGDQKLPEDIIWFETTDHEGRASILEPVSSNSDRLRSGTPTGWSVGQEEGGLGFIITESCSCGPPPVKRSSESVEQDQQDGKPDGGKPVKHRGIN